MPQDWFSQNAPKQQDWFEANAAKPIAPPSLQEVAEARANRKGKDFDGWGQLAKYLAEHQRQMEFAMTKGLPAAGAVALGGELAAPVIPAIAALASKLPPGTGEMILKYVLKGIGAFGGGAAASAGMDMYRTWRER